MRSQISLQESHMTNYRFSSMFAKSFYCSRTTSPSETMITRRSHSDNLHGSQRLFHTT